MYTLQIVMILVTLAAFGGLAFLLSRSIKQFEAKNKGKKRRR